jgi:hypothetical protein
MDIKNSWQPFLKDGLGNFWYHKGTLGGARGGGTFKFGTICVGIWLKFIEGTHLIYL